MESKEYLLLQELEKLKAAHERNEYFTVVILAPQFLVQIIDLLSNYRDEWDDWIERKCPIELTKDELEVYRLAGQLQRKESDRSYIVGALVELFDGGHWDESNAKENFVKFFTKLDDLTSLRNQYAHEYYAKEVSVNRAKNCSQSGIELIELFSNRLKIA